MALSRTGGRDFGGERGEAGQVSGGHDFVSYAHADFAYVRRLVSFPAQRGVDVLFDEEIPTGEWWESTLRER